MPSQTRASIEPPTSASAAFQQVRKRDYGSNQDRAAKLGGGGGLQRDPGLETDRRGEFAPAVSTDVAPTVDRTATLAPAEPSLLDQLRAALQRFDDSLVRQGPDTRSERYKNATQDVGQTFYGNGDSQRSIATKASENAVFLGPSFDLGEFLTLMDTVVGALPDKPGYQSYKRTWGEAKTASAKGDHTEMIEQLLELVDLVERAYEQAESEGGGDGQTSVESYVERTDPELVNRRHVGGHLQNPEGNTWYYEYADGTRDVVHEWVGDEGVQTELVRTERWK